MSLPPAASLHQPTPGYYHRWCQLNDWLLACEPWWRPAPFTTPSPDWLRLAPALAEWLEARTDDECDYFDDHPEALAERLSQWLPALADYPGLVRLPALTSAEDRARATLPETAATDMPGRKRWQAGAFAAAIQPLHDGILDWCCGKGHLARTLARQGPVSVQGLEWTPALVADGNRLARQFGDAVTLRCQDVMASDLAWPAHTHGVALHACGDLHRRLLRLAGRAEAPRLSLSPCCYHLTATDAYQPLSAQARGHHRRLTLSRNELRLAVQETVTAPARVRTQTARISQWRLGFDALQRHLRDRDEYLPVPSHPSRLLTQDFQAFCRWAADKKGLALPASVDWPHWQQVGRQRHRQVRRHELLRHLFRRPLELWLVLDYAVFLEEQGYRVRLGTFCDRALTPRNLLLDAVRDCGHGGPAEN